MPRRPATFTQTDMTRAAKAAAAVGYALEIRADVMRLVPSSETAENSLTDAESDAWDGALEC